MKYGKFIEILKVHAKEFMFVSKAVSDDETRFFMNFVYCENNKLISTDGRRLHILELGDNHYNFEDKKLYKVLKANTKTVWFAEADKETIGEFPNYKRVMPEGEHITFTFEYYRDYSKELAKLYRKLSDKNAISLKFVDDLLVGGSYWEVDVFGEDKAIKFRAGNMTSIIMPMIMD